MTKIYFRMRTMLSGMTVLCITAFFAAGALAQDVSVEALFKRGAVLFNQGKYVASSLDFKEIVNNHPESEWVAPATMMLAKTFFELGDYGLAETSARRLREDFPESRYTEWTYYFDAACAFRRGDADRSAELLASLAGETSDSKLKTRSLSALKYTVLPVVGEQKVFELLSSEGIGRAEFEAVRPVDAQAAKRSVEEMFSEKVPDMAGSVQPSGSALRIGLLAPLTGVNADLGTRLLDGVRSQLITDLTVDGRRIELIVQDTESDMVKAVVKTRALVQEGVVAIIGPVMSESSVAAAVVAQEYGVPFLAPTTTLTGFTDIGADVFQLNFTPVIQAEKLAELAWENLKPEYFAVIASDDPWGRDVGETLSRELVQRGSDHVWTGYFDPNDALSNHEVLMNIREHAPESHVDYDSLVVMDNGTAFPDTVFIKYDLIHGERRLGPVDTIDCVFISATSEYAIQYARQLKEYNISTIIFGDSGWWSNSFAYTGLREHIEGAYIVAPPGVLSKGTGMPYGSGGNAIPLTEDIPFMKGADAAMLLIHCIEHGAHEPEAISTSLRNISDFQGMSGLFRFDTVRRLNTDVTFVTVSNGDFIQFEKTIVQQPGMLIEGEHSLSTGQTLPDEQ